MQVGKKKKEKSSSSRKRKSKDKSLVGIQSPKGEVDLQEKSGELVSISIKQDVLFFNVSAEYVIQ